MPYKRRNQKRKYAKKAKGKYATMRKIAKQVVLKAEETKVAVANGSITSVDMSNLYTAAPLQIITQGTNSNNRVGNEIYLKNVRGRITFRTSGTVPYLVGRVTAMWHPTAYSISGWGVNFVAKEDYTHPSLGPTTEAFLNYNGLASVVYDKIFRINQDITGEVMDRTIDFNLRINKKLKFKSGSNQMLDNQLYVVISTYAPGQTTPFITFPGVMSDFVATFKDA